MCSCASSRDIASSVPVMTKRLPRQRLRPRRRAPSARRPSSRPRARRRSISSRLRGSSNQERTDAASTGPISAHLLELLERCRRDVARPSRSGRPAPGRRARRRGECRGRRAAATHRSPFDFSISREQRSPPTSCPSARAPRAPRRVEVVDVGERLRPARCSTSWAISDSPSPSMFIAPRDAKCSRPRRSFAGHELFSQRHTTSSSGLLQRAAAHRARGRHHPVRGTIRAPSDRRARRLAESRRRPSR